MTTSSIVLRSVTKTYRRGERRISALQDVSFEMSQGELALLVGPSGSGKTTLLNLIAALDRPDRGEIIVGELEVTSLSRSAAARYRNERVGFIFQFYNLLPQLTAAYGAREHTSANAPEAPTGSPPRSGAPRRGLPQ